jgi:hypothetical protein
MHDIAVNKHIALTFLRSLETGPRFDLVAPEARWWIQGHGFLTLEEFKALVTRVAGNKSPSHMVIHQSLPRRTALQSSATARAGCMTGAPMKTPIIS